MNVNGIPKSITIKLVNEKDIFRYLETSHLKVSIPLLFNFFIKNDN